MGLEVLVARTKEELDMCFRVRYEVFGKEYGAYDLAHYPGERESDSFDTLPTTLNLLALYDGKPAGTVRIIQPNEDVARANGWVFGFEMETLFDLSPYNKKGISLGEIPRSSVLREYRSLKDPPVVMTLWAFAMKIARIRGLTHLCASANPETDNLKEALIMYHLLRKKDLVSDDVDIKAKDEKNYEFNSGPYSRSVYSNDLMERVNLENPTEEQLQQFRLPKVLAVFARVGAKFIGRPIYDRKVSGCSMPLVWPISAFNEEILERFDMPINARF
ncbi:MAG: GNAT family N-acetyltransferase [Nanoarchaeota archaeon]|nr:GNAT family N-acetyltransferase [Nanoarchaeota archaeon]